MALHATVDRPKGNLDPVVFRRVAWTRGAGCWPVAEALASEEVVAAGGNLAAACVDRRVDLVVTRRITSFELTPTAAVRGVDLDRIESITIAVGDGPHSPGAATVAARLAHALSVPAELVTVARDDREAAAARDRLQLLGTRHPTFPRTVIPSGSARPLLDTLSPSTLLVLGATEGSWFHRQLVGPGQALATRAPGGSIVVRSAPRRCFHAAQDPAGYVISPHLTVTAALPLLTSTVAPVADGGRLVGVLRAHTLRQVADDTPVRRVMEEPVAVGIHEPLEAARELNDYFEGGPVPVIGPQLRLVGVIDPGRTRDRKEIAA